MEKGGACSLVRVAEVNLGLADARESTPDVSSLGDLMMRRLETQIALAAVPRMEHPQESTMLLDRSLYGELTHLSLWYGRTAHLNTCLMGELNVPQLLEDVWRTMSSFSRSRADRTASS